MDNMFGNHGKSDGKRCGNNLDKEHAGFFPQLFPRFTTTFIHGILAAGLANFYFNKQSVTDFSPLPGIAY